MGKRYKSDLKKILVNNEIVLVDTCCILGYSKGNNFNPILIEEKEENSMRQAKSFSYWKDHWVDYWGIKLFITPEVKDEVSDGSDKRPKFNKLKYNNKGKANIPNSKRYECAARSEWKRKKDLIKLIQDKNAVFNLNDRQQKLYDLLYKEKDHFRYQFKPLEETDFTELIKAIVLAKKMGKTALISNDSGLRDGWRNALDEIPELKKKLNFYTRWDVDLYLSCNWSYSKNR